MLTAMVLMVVALGARWGGAAIRQRRDAMAALRRRLVAVEEALRGPAADWRSALGAQAAPSSSACELEAMRAVLTLARREGLPAAQSIAALRRQVIQTEDRCHEGQRLWRLFAGRLVVVLGLALAGRCWLVAGRSGGNGLLAAVSPADGAALILAACLACLSLAALHRLLPATWSWAGNLTPVTCAWLSAHLTGRAPPGSEAPYAADLRALRHRELRAGVSLARARREAVEAWAREAAREDGLRLRRVEDVLPILELVGIGGASALMLLAPGLAWLG